VGNLKVKMQCCVVAVFYQIQHRFLNEKHLL